MRSVVRAWKLVTCSLFSLASLQPGSASEPMKVEPSPFTGVKNILLLLDSSYSMRDKLRSPKVTKTLAAREVIEQLIKKTPTSVQFGLRVFGQKRSGIDDVDCKESALLIPLGTKRKQLLEQLRSMAPAGMSALTYSLQKSMEEDLQDVRSSSVILLLSDGADTCGADPCAYVRQAVGQNLAVPVVVLSLGLGKSPGEAAQLHCIAETSHGEFYEYEHADELVRQIVEIGR